MHAEDARSGTPGRARAKAEQIRTMAQVVMRDTPDQIVVHLRSGSTDFWHAVGEGWFELVESTRGPGDRSLAEEMAGPAEAEVVPLREDGNVRPPVLRLHLDGLVVDNFAGGGGASTGIAQAIGRDPDLAINHDAEALAMHRANHPHTRHLCESVWDVDPKKACGGRQVALAWFSPDCTFHSKARGAKPLRDRNRARRRRGLAWAAIRWAEAVRPRMIALENVEEFAKWGPLTDDGRPDPDRQGQTFARWVSRLRNLGYAVEWRELRACDHGAPTSRKRLFVVARSDGHAIVWPEASHGPKRALPFRTAAECIDWDLPCPSIFERERPLAENTLRRIARGIQRYVLEAASPFIVPMQRENRPVGVDEPLQTVTTQGNKFNLVEPFLVPLTHHGDARSRKVSEPAPTITGAHRGELAVVAPTIARIGQTGSHGGKVNDVRDPLTTVTSKAEHLLIASTLIQRGWGERPTQAPRCMDIQKPIGTLVGQGEKHALVSAFLARHFGGHENDGSALPDPIHTITATDHHSLVTSHLVKFYGTAEAGAPVTEPLPTVTANGKGGGHIAEVRAFLLAYYSHKTEPQLGLPLNTVTTKDRFALVQVAGVDYVIADIGMRMLSPRELFNAQGFDPAYDITTGPDGFLTKTAQIRMCGNSVPPPVARAIVEANLGLREAVAA